MTRTISVPELVCIAGISIWTLGEWHSHIETQSVIALTKTKEKTLVERLEYADNQIASLKKSIFTQSATDTDEFKSRVLLDNIIKQTGLSQLEFPNIGQLLNPKSSLPLQIILTERQSILNALPSIAPAEGWLASGFGDRADPMTKAKSDHKGLDISNNEGTEIKAPSDGVIRYTGKYGRFGNYIAIVHGFGVVTKYAHLKEVRVQAGQAVKKGDVIALMGSTGRSTGTHLHYEVWVNDKPFNPYAFIPKVMLQNARVNTNIGQTTDNIPVRQAIEVAYRH